MNKVIIKTVLKEKVEKSQDEVVKENIKLLQQLGVRKEGNMTRDNLISEQDLEKEVIDSREQSEAEVQIQLVPQAIVEEKGDKPMVTGATARRAVSLKFGVVGTGQAGGRISEVFGRYGYKSVALNTAAQDLEFLELPKADKFLLNMEGKEFGGAGKDLAIGAASLEENETEVQSWLEEKLEGTDVSILITSLAGGSGSGSAETLTHILYELGNPVIVIVVLPGSFDDTQGKSNAVTTLAALSELSDKQVISSLILIDNKNVERKFTGLSQADFFDTANQAIVEPIHLFNSVSVTPSSYESLDPMDWATVLINSGNCSVIGTNTVPSEYLEDDEMALIDAVVSGLDDGLLASGFELREAQSVGILVTAKQEVLEKVPYTSIALMFKYIADEFDSAKSFKGVYAVPSDNDDITIRFIFSGMGLPKDRIEGLREDAARHVKALDEKRRKTSMNVGLKRDKADDEIDRKIAKAKRNKTGLGKLIGGKKPIKRRR